MQLAAVSPRQTHCCLPWQRHVFHIKAAARDSPRGASGYTNILYNTHKHTRAHTCASTFTLAQEAHRHKNTQTRQSSNYGPMSGVNETRGSKLMKEIMKPLIKSFQKCPIWETLLETITTRDGKRCSVRLNCLFVCLFLVRSVRTFAQNEPPPFLSVSFLFW